MLPAFLVIFFGLASIVPSAQSAELGTRDEAVAMVKRVQEKFKKDGPDATFSSITEKAAEFHDRDLYAFAYDMNGVNVAHGADPALVGENRINLTDQSGRFLIQEFVAVAKSRGRGWVDYCWPNPVSVEDKSSYVERLNDNYFVGVGVFRQ
jgi:signal transduction histidine kinase